MRIVDICEFYSAQGGGVKTYIDQKIDAAARLGRQVSIIAPGPADLREPRAGGEIIWVKSPTLPFDSRYHMFWGSAAAHQLLGEIDPDVIEASSVWRGAHIAARYQGRASKALFAHQDPVAVYPQTFLTPALSPATVDKLCFWFWRYLRKLAANFDSIVVGGEWLAQRFARFGLPEPVAAPMGVDKSLFAHDLRARAARMEMLLACGTNDPDATLFIAVSRHHPEKRVATMLEGFKRFAARRPAGLFLIGDGPMRSVVERQAAKIDGVHVAGPIRDRKRLARFMASADYFLHGGAAETFGLVVAEALASGLPLIAPDRGGAADLSHPAYAETYEAGDPGALLAAMMRMTARDRDRASVAARAGANRINTPMEHFKILFDHYARISDEKAARARAA